MTDECRYNEYDWCVTHDGGRVPQNCTRATGWGRDVWRLLKEWRSTHPEMCSCRYCAETKAALMVERRDV
jgi:hypothetical protein